MQCTKFGQLNVRKIIKIVASMGCVCWAQNMPKIRFQPGPHWGSLQCSPDPLAGFKGPTSKGKGGMGGKERG